MRTPRFAATAGAIALAVSVVSVPVAHSAEPAVNGPGECVTIDSTGHVRAPGPGECAQFGREGQGNSTDKAKNVILVIGDGMGHQEITAARNYAMGAGGRFEGLDNLTAAGAYTTYSIDKDGAFNYVPDSAATATGWATGTKTYNNALGVQIDEKPVENLIETAKRAGKRTGNVTTSELQDATPAALGSHSTKRSCYTPKGGGGAKDDADCGGADGVRSNGGLGSISEQILDTRADVTLGGGAKYFDARQNFSGTTNHPFLHDGLMDWKAGRTLRENAVDNGYRVVGTADELNAVTEASQDAPVLGLFSGGNMTRKFARTTPTVSGANGEAQTCQAADRGTQPELAGMTSKAIDLLNKDNTNGFFLQVESASIDKADHDADACGVIGELIQLEEAVRTAVDFARQDGNTLVVVTADHAHTAQIVENGTDYVSPVTRLRTKDGSDMSVAFGTIPAEDIYPGGNYSTQHTGSQVRIAAFGPGAENVNGQLDQTDAHYVIANAMGLNDGWTPATGNAARYGALGGSRAGARGGQCYLASPGAAPQVGECAQFGLAGQGMDSSVAKNVVVMIADGTADMDITAARNYLKGASGRFGGIDNQDFTGYVTTYSLDRANGLPDYVPDSAVTGTAWNSGVKSYDNAVGVDLHGNPVAALGELAKARGKKIGNVTTAEIQDATPATFGTHSELRSFYSPSGDEGMKPIPGGHAQRRENGGLGSITEQLVDLRADVTLGGGAKYFGTEVKKGGTWAGTTRWSEGKSVMDNVKDNGFQVVTTASELQGLTTADQKAPVLGLFAPGNMPRKYNKVTPTADGYSGAPTRCEANPEYTADTPSLASMTGKALDLLRSEEGFVLQVESASPDKGSHDSDPCGTIGEIDQFDESIRAVQDWVERTREPTLVITTADHAHTPQITQVGEKTAGVTHTVETHDGDGMTLNYATGTHDKPLASEHTGAQVHLGASGPGAANLSGQIDQTDIFIEIARTLGVDPRNNGFTPGTKWGGSQPGTPTPGIPGRPGSSGSSSSSGLSSGSRS